MSFSRREFLTSAAMSSLALRLRAQTQTMDIQGHNLQDQARPTTGTGLGKGILRSSYPAPMVGTGSTRVTKC